MLRSSTLQASAKVVREIVYLSGALACLLVWLGVTPKDLLPMTFPHWLWLVLGLLLFALGLASSLRSYILHRKVLNTLKEKSVSTRRYPTTVFTVQHVEIEFITHKEESYQNRLIVVLSNSTLEELEVWTPAWESRDVQFQPPFRSGLQLEGTEQQGGGWRAGAWNTEQPCIAVPMSHTFKCWIGLSSPPGEGLKRRIVNQNTGTAVFPVKIRGSLYEVEVKL
jgi:hypothetical protein